MFPVLKKADWRRKMKNRAMRASPRVRGRYSPAFSADFGSGVDVTGL